MAEVRKKKKVEKYDITEMVETKNEKTTKVKKTNSKTNTKAKKEEKKEEKKKSLWVRFRIFCHGVASEFKKVNWPSKNDMIKYSIATIVFVVFLALFFYLIDVIFAAILGLVK